MYDDWDGEGFAPASEMLGAPQWVQDEDERLHGLGDFDAGDPFDRANREADVYDQDFAGAFDGHTVTSDADPGL